MIIALNLRVYTTSGEIFSRTEDLNDYNKRYPLRIVKSNLKTLQFSIKEQVVHLDVNSTSIPFSMTGFKSICSLLKVPASYLNKSLSDQLILENLNNNPMRVDEPISIYIRESGEFEYISAVSVNDDFRSEDLSEILAKSQFLMNNELEETDVTLSNEEGTFYFLRDAETLATGQTFRRGVALVYGEGVDLGFSIHPFYRFYFDGEDSYDFLVAKALKKVSRKEKSYKIMVGDEIRHFDINKYEKNFEDILKLVRAANDTKEISFAFLKQIKSAINRTYSFQAGIYDTTMVLGTILPEFDMFSDQHKEELKLLPTFEHNNLLLPFFQPKLYSMFEAETTTIENPLFFNRQRRNVYKLLVKNAENYFRAD